MSDLDSGEDLFGETGILSNSEEERDSNLLNHEKTDETDDSKTDKKKVTATKTRKIVVNPQPKLDPSRICGERGIKAIMVDFQSVKLKGKGHEKSDLEIILSKMEHWAHRFFPKLPFDDCVDSVAKLGNTKLVQVHMKKFRMEVSEIEAMTEEDVIDPDVIDPDVIDPDVQFDSIMEQTINECNSSVLSQPSQSFLHTTITEDQQQRMAENRRRAEEKRKSRLLLNSSLCSDKSLNLDTSEKIKTLEQTRDAHHLETMEDSSELLDIDMFLGNLPE